jgi:ArsR family transcriptional regulator
MMNRLSAFMSRKLLEKAGMEAEALRRFKAEVFQVLGHPTRIHIVEVLRNGELAVSAILEQIGVEPANLSQHLSVLRSRRLVTNRKEGNQVLYALRDPLLVEVLETMRRYFQKHLEEAMGMLKGIEQE